MPPTVPTPTEMLPLAPTPCANISGNMPKIIVSEVIKIGRKRIRDASMVASMRSPPLSCNSLANSTIRMAFFADRPMVASRPTWKYTSLESIRMFAAPSAPSTPRGTTRITANGTDQLSYKAARHRNTTRMDRANRAGACDPERRS